MLVFFFFLFSHGFVQDSGKHKKKVSKLAHSGETVAQKPHILVPNGCKKKKRLDTKEPLIYVE